MPAEMPFFAVLGRTRVVLGELVADKSPSDYSEVFDPKPSQVRRQVLMRTIGDLSLVTKTVAPFATVSVAVRIMQENALRVLAVTEDGRFLGIVTRDRLKSSATDVPVRDVVEPLVIELQANTAVRAAARLFAENELDVVPVISDRGFQGLLTVNQLLIELGRSWDPMTGLSWSDRLRDWGVDALQAGQEISLAFIDLNDFGEYNKRHGHIVGDRVLKATAKLLSTEIDPDTDVLVRYGGDEFVIGSVRPRQELEALGHSLSQQTTTVEGVPEPVSFSVGFAGGKRTRERERIHFASTLDNLINLASQDSLAHKPKKPTNGTKSVSRHSPNLVDVDVSSTHVSALVSVTLGSVTGMGHTKLESGLGLQAVANATAIAVAKIDPNLEIEVKDIVIFRRWDGHPVAAVLATVGQDEQRIEVRAQGSSDRGVFEAVVEAVVEAAFHAGENMTA